MVMILTISLANVVLKCLFSMPEYQKARSLSVFLSMPSGEISTTEIVKDAFSQGKGVFMPYTYKLPKARDHWPTSIMDMVQLRSLDDFDALKPDKWGIPTPDTETIDERRNCFGGQGRTEGEAPKEATDTELDIIVMPGLAFDHRLERLGHGKGYYDFFLQRYLWHTQKAHIKMPFLGKKVLNFSFNLPISYR
jgi:5-formyltetrahydrofolate cyclo-ligase